MSSQHCAQTALCPDAYRYLIVDTGLYEESGRRAAGVVEEGIEGYLRQIRTR